MSSSLVLLVHYSSGVAVAVVVVVRTIDLPVAARVL
jgi:hypothetical protein